MFFVKRYQLISERYELKMNIWRTFNCDKEQKMRSDMTEICTNKSFMPTFECLGWRIAFFFTTIGAFQWNEKLYMKRNEQSDYVSGVILSIGNVSK